MTPIAVTIAGSDSSGGAGTQAKTFSALDVYGASVITAFTAQNTRRR
jgi:hydroxymethylpyrimidine/phosphomethylpyrimidine kinase